MKTKTLPSQEELQSLLSYDIETGVLRWKQRSPSMFSSNGHPAEHNAAKWNARYSGAIALSAEHGSGYLYGAINGVLYLSHRVIWKLMTGDDPCSIDHINGNKSDNRLVNLRAIDGQAENAKNVRRPKTNTSGIVGVRKKGHRWSVRIKVNKREVHLGVVDTIGEAADLRRAAERKYGFHANHGRAS